MDNKSNQNSAFENDIETKEALILDQFLENERK